MTEWATDVLERMGYVGLAFLMALENIFPPIPSEVVMPYAGYSSARGELGFAGIVLAGTAGSVLGALVLYGLGHLLGEQRILAWAERHGPWLTVSRRDVERARGWFQRHGSTAVLLGRLVPGVRSLISIPAGVVGMPLARFLALTALGTAAWAAVLAWLGRLLGERHDAVAKVLDPIVYVLLGLFVVAYLVRLLRWRRRST